jgi:hypothetical protein
MRFMMMIKGDKNHEAGIPPKPELIAAIGKLTEEMFKSGVMVGAGGLFPSAMGVRLNAANGKIAVTDGPFTEVKELIGGYAIVDVKSKQEAIEWGKRFLRVHQEVLGPSYEGESEIRQMFEGPGCGPEGLKS